jgi:hypothetical protein
VSLRARAESWLRTFDAMDTIDLVTRLGLVAILVSDHVAGYEWYLKAPTRGLAIAGLLVPTLARRSSFWGVLTFAFTLRTLTDWWFQDNHLFVFTYWCLTLALALRLAQPLPALATSARLLVGLSFALATLWKAFLSPDYMDGTYFHHTVLTDPRFRDLGAILGRVPESLYTANLDQLARLRAWRPMPSAPAAASPSAWTRRTTHWPGCGRSCSTWRAAPRSPRGATAASSPTRRPS